MDKISRQGVIIYSIAPASQMKEFPPEWYIKNGQRCVAFLYETVFAKLLLYGNVSFDWATSTLILNASAEYILSSKSFDDPLLLYFLFIYALFLRL